MRAALLLDPLGTHGPSIKTLQIHCTSTAEHADSLYAPWATSLRVWLRLNGVRRTV